MTRRNAAAGCCLAICLALPGVAGAGESARPREMPPVEFVGRQYVDSRGCAYVRRHAHGKVVWVARLGEGHRPLCGLRPTFALAPVGAMVQRGADVGADVGAAASGGQGRGVGGRPAGRAKGVPPGFRPAWSDGRLNPLRGPRTAQGDAQMLRIWTETVPMKRRR